MRVTSLPTLMAAAAVLLMLSGTAEAACTVNAKPVLFGVVDVARQTQGRGSVEVNCDEAVTFSVGLSAGSGERVMRGPSGGRLPYRLFPDASYSVDWGDGLGMGAPVDASSNGKATNDLTIYGVVPAQPSVPEGEYSDSLTVTLQF
jgi:spore coat protein U-like protein